MITRHFAELPTHYPYKYQTITLDEGEHSSYLVARYEECLKGSSAAVCRREGLAAFSVAFAVVPPDASAVVAASAAGDAAQLVVLPLRCFVFLPSGPLCLAA